MDIMKSIGDTLAKRRQARGVTFERVYESTKIRAQILDAIEKGNWGELPGDVYVRGFIIRYAQFLGLNGLELIRPYFEAAQNPMENPMKDERQLQEPEPIRFGWLLGLGGLIILVIFFKAIGSYIRRKSVPLNPAVSVASPTDVIVSTRAMATESMAAGRHQLQIYSPNELWLRVTTEKKNFEGFIPQRSTWTFEAEGTFTVRLGHTREVLMNFDGETIALQENQKKVVLPNEN